MLLDDWMPEAEFLSRHELQIAASPVAVFEAIERADFSRPALVRALMGLRALPMLFRRRTPPPLSAVPNDSTIRRLLGIPFTVLERVPPAELVLGLEGAFWTMGGGLRPRPSEHFRAAIPPGTARALWNFTVRAKESGSLLRTETRITTGDGQAHRQFRRYWKVIAPGSALVRRALLREIQREALRA